MEFLSNLTDGTVRQIRETVEDPPRVSIIDVISLVTGHTATVCSHTLQALRQDYPEVGSNIYLQILRPWSEIDADY